MLLPLLSASIDSSKTVVADPIQHLQCMAQVCCYPFCMLLPSVCCYPFCMLLPLLCVVTPSVCCYPFCMLLPSVCCYPFCMLLPLLYVVTPSVCCYPFCVLLPLLCVVTASVCCYPFCMLLPLLYVVTPSVCCYPFCVLLPLLSLPLLSASIASSKTVVADPIQHLQCMAQVFCYPFCRYPFCLPVLPAPKQWWPTPFNTYSAWLRYFVTPSVVTPSVCQYCQLQNSGGRPHSTPTVHGSGILLPLLSLPLLSASIASSKTVVADPIQHLQCMAQVFCLHLLSTTIHQISWLKHLIHCSCTFVLQLRNFSVNKFFSFFYTGG